MTPPVAEAAALADVFGPAERLIAMPGWLAETVVPLGPVVTLMLAFPSDTDVVCPPAQANEAAEAKTMLKTRRFMVPPCERGKR